MLCKANLWKKNKNSKTGDKEKALEDYAYEYVKKRNEESKAEIRRLLKSKELHPRKIESATMQFDEWAKLPAEKRRKIYGDYSLELLFSSRRRNRES